ncbi:MAG: hypothetical protein GYA15_03040 [Leptolinea sp.]|jgi:hypothetical protein|nr:hypothetical protein [Leptolinea sp.]
MADMSSEITDLLAQAIRAIQYGHKPAAAAYLNRILEIDPDNMDAWRWLSECMPNQSKRNYCLQRAGLSAASIPPRTFSTSETSTVFNQSAYADVQDEAEEPTLAESHTRRAAQRGQKRAELPPHYRTALPIDIEIPTPRTNQHQQTPENRRSHNVPVITVRKQTVKPRKSGGGKKLFIGILVVVLCSVVGYGLFGTGLTTGEKVWNWVTLQIKNNTADLAIFRNRPDTSEPSSLVQPAAASVSPTPQPVEDQNIREAAEIPVDVVPSVEPPIETPAAAVPAESDQNQADTGEAEAPASEASVSSTDAASPAETPAAVAGAAPAESTGFVAGPTVIGHSVKGNNLEIMQFGNGPVERMMVAGVHGGNEWNTTALADQLIDYIQNNPGVIPANRTLYILRLMNPDGEARGHNLDGRTNERGVDLNRNWDAFWVVDWPRDGCWNYRPINAGSSPFSEPETIAVRDFIQSHHISALVNYHSAALGLFAGGRPPETESVHLAKSIAAVTSYAYPAIDTGCKYTGQFTDWLAQNGIAAVDLELTNHTDTDFEENRTVLDVLMKWEPTTGPKSLDGLITMAQNLPEKPSTLQQIKKFGVQSLNELNGLIFGRQEEK